MSKVSREEIIAAAIRLFFKNGYHATSMQDVAREVAIKKPSLYHHFESKEAILLAILETGMDRLLADLYTISASDHDSATKLRDAIRAHAVSIAAYPEAAAIFFREDRGLGSDYLDHYIAKRDLFEEVFRSIVDQGVSARQFRSTDVPITVQAVLGMVNWMTRWYRSDGRLSAEQIADSFADMILSGLVQKQ